MKINNLNVNKEFLKKMSKRTISLALAATTLLGLTSCNNKGKEEKEIGYNVSSSLVGTKDGLYTYVVDRSNFYSENYDFNNTIRTLNFAKIEQSEEYGTNIFNDKTSAFYRENIKIVLPDSYSMYNTNEWLNSDNFDYTLKYQKISELAGVTYDVISSSMSAKRDLDTKVVLPEGKKEFKEGDTISSKAIYYDGQLISYYQDGVGSECENVKNAIIGDPNLAISSITNYYNLNDTIDISYEELYNYQEDLNYRDANKKTL